MDKKLLLITHVADEDGITPIILARLVYSNVDYILAKPGEVDQYYLDNVFNYDIVHITDLNISEELAKKIDADDELRGKTLIFDHHASAFALNKYAFDTVIVENGDRKESATSIYYDYLCGISSNGVLKKDSVKGLVEQVRIIDTYDFKTEKDQEAHNLDLLFSILGRENYLDYFSKYVISHEFFEYGENEQFLIKLEKDKLDNYIKNRSEDMMRIKIEGHTAGVVYAERYRSQLGNYLITKYNDIDFAIIINIATSVSYRGNDKVDLSVFSAKRGGGGHKNASGSPLPDDILLRVTNLIFEDAEFIKEEK